jgi:hypothetical protein
MRSDWLVLGAVVAFGLFTAFKDPSPGTTAAPAWATPAVPTQSASSSTAPVPTAVWPLQPEPVRHSAPLYSPRTFHGSTCTSDCSGHEAGYEWAEEHGIDDPDDCDGNSASFVGGCRSYAEEQAMSEEGGEQEEE